MTMAEDSKSVAIIIVVSVLCVVLITAIVTLVVVFIIRRRPQTKAIYKDITSENAPSAKENEAKRTAKNYENMSYFNGDSKNIFTHGGILVENLGSYIENAMKNGKLSTEYAELPTHDSLTEGGNEQANVPKNRFNNIKSFDNNRVVLQNINNNTGNY